MTTPYLVAWIGVAVAFAILDLIWLGYIARDFYANAMGDLRADSFRISPAIAFYIVMVTGTVIFAVRPALGAESWTTATMLGAAFGFFCYATYDLTNLATTRDWPTFLAIVDMVWGTLLTATAATAGYTFARVFS